ncbi:MAG TPA: hypothetical protein VHR45_01225 [Thermoanaerobaculia bacterium]|nr:hypothetical protein [Thermoanaerobaculia bacterium]
MPSQLAAGEVFVAEVMAENLRRLEVGGWPQLFLSHHLLDPDGRALVWDGRGHSLLRAVGPGQRTAMRVTLAAPTEPGSYLLEWDLVSEDECWFAECGSGVARVLLVVPRGGHPTDPRSGGYR